MGDDLPALVQLMSSLASDGFSRAALGAVVFMLLSGVAGAVVGLTLAVAVAGPALRWSFGRAGVWGCLATIVLTVGGGLGFGWAGAWVGGGRAVTGLIEDHLVIEELALRALVTSASEGNPSLSTDELADRLAAAFETGDGVVQEIVADVRAELREADPGGDLEVLLPRQAFEDAIATMRDRGLADPEMLARVWAAGGFVAAMDSGDPTLHGYVTEVLDVTAPMRAEIQRLVSAAVWPSAVPGPVTGVLLPLFFIVLIAVLGRWWREPTAG